MLQRFCDYINKQHLFSPEQEVLLAVSGGRDSVAMLHLMHRAGYSFAIAHCNFHLRPGDAERDQDFVRRLADTYGVPFHTIDFDTLSYASGHRLSVEEAARVLRYDYFDRLISTHGYNAVATAHHADDSVETFFLNLFRGTGIAGLHGIRPRSGHVVHPMLCFSRSDINRYIEANRLEYVDDYTNTQTKARRNRIRLQLMPLLRDIYPAVDQVMLGNIERLAETEQVFDSHIKALAARLIHPVKPSIPGLQLPMWAISLDDIAALEPQRTLLFELLRPFGFNASTVDDLLSLMPEPRTGSLFQSPTHKMVVDRDRLLVAAETSVAPPLLRHSILPPTRFALPSSPSTIVVDADAVRQPLSLRLWEPGDRFMPFGMNQFRLVSDYLSDIKLNRIEKAYLHLLVDADGRVVWVVGLRADNRFRITATTRRLLEISVVQ